MAAPASLRTCHFPPHTALKSLRQKSSLFGFALFSIALIAASESLGRISNARQGLTQVDGSYHYFWAYGPALAFTAATAFWNKLVYRAQRGMPWILLKKPASGEVLFLDYVTSLNIVSLYRSLKRRHFPVALTILGDSIFRLLITFSSGLFRAELVAVTTEVKIVTLDHFDLGQIGYPNVVDTALSLWADRQQQKKPLWLTDTGNAIQSLVGSDKPAATWISANVSVFEVTQHCQGFDWTLPPSKNGVQSVWTMAEFVPRHDLNVLGKFCPSIQARFRFNYHGFDTIEPHEWLLVNECANGTRATGVSSSHGIFAVFVYRLGADEDRNISAVLCLPSYSIKKRRITTSWAGSAPGEIRIVDYTTASSALDLGNTPLKITEGILQSVRPVPLHDKNEIGRPVTSLWMMMNHTMDWKDWAMYRSWNSTYLTTALKQTFQNLAVHVAKTRGVTVTNSTILGTTETHELRLRAQAVPLRAIQALLGTLILVLVILAFLDQELSVPTNETPTLLDIAAVLAKSPELSELFKSSEDHASSKSGDRLPSRLLGHKFLLSQDAITVSPVSIDSGYGKVTYNQEKPLWRPLGRTVPYQAIIAFASIAVVAALEGLYQYSATHDGIVDVSLESGSKYWWSLVPTLAMVLLGLSYTTISFSVLILHPYQELLRRKKNNMDVMEYDPLERVAVATLPHAVRCGYFAVAAALIVPILTPFLSVASSGLYTAHETNQTRGLDLAANGWFDLGTAWKLDEKQPESNPIDNITYHFYNEAVQYNNLTFPRGSHDEFAFASVDWNPVRKALDLSKSDTQVVTLRARIPVVRGQINCSLLASDPAAINYSNDGDILVSPPPSCKAYPGSWNTITPATARFQLRRPASPYGSGPSLSPREG